MINIQYSPLAVYGDFILTIIGIFLNSYFCYYLIKETFKKKDSESYSLIWIVLDVLIVTLHYSLYSGNIHSVIDNWDKYASVNPLIALVSQWLGFLYSLGDVISVSFILFFLWKKRRKLKMFLYYLFVVICSQIIAIPFFFEFTRKVWWYVIPLVISSSTIFAILAQDIKSFLTKDTFSMSFKYLIGLVFLNIFWFFEDMMQFFAIGQNGLIINCFADIIIIILSLLLLGMKLNEIKCTPAFFIKHNDTKRKNALSFLVNNLKEMKQEDILYIDIIKKGISENENFFIEMNDGDKYQVKLRKLRRYNLQHSKKIFRIIENESILYFDKKTGSYIKKWIKGHELLPWEANNTNTIKFVAKEIEKFHHPPNLVNGVKKFQGYEIKDSNFSEFDEKITIAYKNLVLRYKKLANVFSHNSLWRKNIIINSSRAFFLDEDDASMNNKYWDFANYIRAEGLGKNEIKKFVKYANLYESTLIDMCYINSVWFYNYIKNEFDATRKINKILKKTKKTILKFFKMVVQTELEKRIFKKIE